MTERIREFLRNRREDGPCIVVDLDVVRDNYSKLRPRPARHARVLRREGEPGAGGAAAAWPSSARASTPLRSSRSSWCSRPARRRTASPSATRSRRSATSRARSSSACASSRSIARPRSRRSRALPRPASSSTSRCSAASCATAPAPSGRCRASSAACPRWRSDVLEHAYRARPRGLWRVVPRRLAAAQHGSLGPGARLGLRRSSANAPSAASTCRWSISAAASRRST